LRHTAPISRRSKDRNQHVQRAAVRFPQQRRYFRVEPRPLPELPLLPEGTPILPPVQQPLPFDKVISILSARIDRHEQKMDAKLERLQATQLTLCEQMKDVRMSLPLQRRPLSGSVQGSTSRR
jgi:hypothetical protein